MNNNFVEGWHKQSILGFEKYKEGDWILTWRFITATTLNKDNALWYSWKRKKKKKVPFFNLHSVKFNLLLETVAAFMWLFYFVLWLKKTTSINTQGWNAVINLNVKSWYQDIMIYSSSNSVFELQILFCESV